MSSDLVQRVVARYLGAAAIAPDKLEALLLKVRKKATASFTWKNLVDVITHLGGKVEKIVGFVPITKGLVVEETEVAAAAKHDEMAKNVVSSLPTSPKHGQLYLTKLSPVTPSRFNDFAIEYEGAFGNEGWRISMPDGKTHIALPGDYDIGNAQQGWRPVPAVKVSIYKTLDWLNKEGGWIELANKALNLEAIEPSVPRTRENTGSCGVCFQNVKLKPATVPKVVLHGYQRPGTGQVHGNCFGTGYPPFELAPDATKAFLQQVVVPQREQLAEYRRKLLVGEITEISLGVYGSHVIRVDDPTWEHELKGAIKQTEKRLAQADESVQIYTALVHHWKQRPLPKEGEPHINWYFKGRQAGLIILRSSGNHGMDKLAHVVAARFEAMQEVGEVAVDSGTLLVIDPAYLDSWGTGEHPDLSMEGYRTAWKEGRNQLNFANGGTAAVLIKGFGGDGTYPVLTEAVQGDEHGELLGSFAVDFTGPNVGDTVAEKVAAKFKRKKKLDSGNTLYEYSDRQIANRNKKKAERIEKLRKSISDLRRKVKRDLKSEDPEKSMTALAVALIDHTYERVGNEDSADDGHYGVTGWKKKHITFNPKGATIKYKGKSGVKHEKKITDSAIRKALKDAYEACDDDGDCLLSWGEGAVTAEKVNEYLEPFDVTAKDIRGFHANREMQDRLKDIRSNGKKLPTDKKAREKILKGEFLKALDDTAEAVGHEASTLRSQYLVPGLEESYLKDGTVSDKFGSLLDGTLEERVATRYLYDLL